MADLTPPAGLRDRIAKAIDDADADTITDAVMAVRDRHMARLAEAAAQAELDRCAAVNARRDAEHRAERAEALLAEADAYLGATHTHAARHDVLGAGGACAGCDLRQQIAALDSDAPTP